MSKQFLKGLTFNVLKSKEIRNGISLKGGKIRSVKKEIKMIRENSEGLTINESVN